MKRAVQGTREFAHKRTVHGIAANSRLSCAIPRKRAARSKNPRRRLSLLIRAITVARRRLSADHRERVPPRCGEPALVVLSETPRIASVTASTPAFLGNQPSSARALSVDMIGTEVAMSIQPG